MRGYELVSVIFVHEITDPLTSLVKQLDQQVAQASAGRSPQTDKLGVFLVVCSNDPQMKQELQDLIAGEVLKHVVVCTFAAGGPPRYKLTPDAEVTALVYHGSQTVAANLTTRKGEFNDAKAGDIAKAVKQALKN
ncbi:hypothetical protein AYO40_00825 [Planctomycetaceae bacterium SCGC AG-212-D15]|nr:hypothetical protein AYO40_00825 [Planctomycetaceae bacterium SCGC AG-212-D15]